MTLGELLNQLSTQGYESDDLLNMEVSAIFRDSNGVYRATCSTTDAGVEEQDVWDNDKGITVRVRKVTFRTPVVYHLS